MITSGMDEQIMPFTTLFKII